MTTKDQAETRLLELQAKKLELRLNHEVARDASRVYHFCAPLVDSAVDVCMDVLTKWTYYSDEPITLAFNSPGGGVFAGFALFDFVRELVEKGHHIETSVYGFAASMAGVLLQAGTVRTIRPNAWFMAHEASTMSAGTYSALKDQTELLKKLQDRTMEILVGRSDGKTSLKTIKSKTSRKDWWLSADEALAAGFVDKIILP